MYQKTTYYLVLLFFFLSNTCIVSDVSLAGKVAATSGRDHTEARGQNTPTISSQKLSGVDNKGKVTSTRFGEKLLQVAKKYKKSIIILSVIVITFLTLRYSSLQEEIILPNNFSKEEANKVGLEGKRSDTNFDSTFFIREEGKSDIYGYRWKHPKQLPEGAMIVNTGGKLNASGKGVILYFKGNAEKCFLPKHDPINCFYDVLEMDYPGKGGSAGRIRKEKDITDFAERCYEYVVKLGYTDIILMGYSLGCFSASYVAAKYYDDPRIKMLILDSAFSDLYHFKGSRLAPFLRVILRYKLSNIDNLAKVRVPIAIRHGKNDEVVDYSNYVRLKKSLEDRGAKLICDSHNGDHAGCSNGCGILAIKLIDIIQEGLSMQPAKK